MRDPIVVPLDKDLQDPLQWHSIKTASTNSRCFAAVQLIFHVHIKVEPTLLHGPAIEEPRQLVEGQKHTVTLTKRVTNLSKNELSHHIGHVLRESVNMKATAAAGISIGVDTISNASMKESFNFETELEHTLTHNIDASWLESIECTEEISNEDILEGKAKQVLEVVPHLMARQMTVEVRLRRMNVMVVETTAKKVLGLKFGRVANKTLKSFKCNHMVASGSIFIRGGFDRLYTRIERNNKWSAKPYEATVDIVPSSSIVKHNLPQLDELVEVSPDIQTRFLFEHTTKTFSKIASDPEQRMNQMRKKRLQDEKRVLKIAEKEKTKKRAGRARAASAPAKRASKKNRKKITAMASRTTRAVKRNSKRKMVKRTAMKARKA